MPELQTVTQRQRLAVRRDSHWHKVGNGQFIGFRKMTPSSGQWSARYRHPETLKQEYLALGDLGHIRDADRFTAAKLAAEEWFVHLGRGGSTKANTVYDGCMAYLEHLKSERGERVAADVDRRFKQYVLDDPLFSNIELAKLTERHIKIWLTKLKNRPSQSGPNRGEKRSASSLNRDITPFRAALNYCLREKMTTVSVWSQVLKPIAGADKRRQIILSKNELADLIKVSPKDLSTFIRALSSIPLRPGAMANLCVKDFNRATSQLTIPIDKADAGREVGLPENTARLFLDLAKGKLPNAHLFTRDNGKPWDKDSWKTVFKDSARTAGLKEETTIYALRHTGITSLIEIGLPTLTIAQISGTSVRMIEKNYGHLTDRMSKAALSQLAI